MPVTDDCSMGKISLIQSKNAKITSLLEACVDAESPTELQSIDFHFSRNLTEPPPPPPLPLRLLDVRVKSNLSGCGGHTWFGTVTCWGRAASYPLARADTK